MFSIVDIQAEEDFEEEERETADSEIESPAPYPIRASISITKVLFSIIQLVEYDS